MVTPIQKKLWKAYGKVAKKLPNGEFKVYRPIEYGTDPIQQVYLRGTAKVAFAPNKSFESNNIHGFDLLETYIDAQLNDVITTQTGDIMYEPIEQTTYVIVDQEPHLPIKSIRCPNRISIKRATYGNSGNGFGPQSTIVGQNVPAQVHAGGGGTEGGLVGQQDSGAGDSVWTMFLYMPSGSIQKGDVITDEQGNRSEVLRAHFTHWGYKLITRERNE